MSRDAPDTRSAADDRHDDPSTGRVATDRETFRAHAAGARPVVVHAAFDLAVETTPLAAYATLAGRSSGGTVDERPDARYAFLLESAEKVAASDPDGAFRPGGADPERHARYSFVGWDPAGVVTVEPDGVSVAVPDPADGGVTGSAGDGADAPGEVTAAASELLVEAVDGIEADPAGGGDDHAAPSDHRPGGRDALDRLRAAMPDVRRAGFGESDRPRLRGGLVGFLSYEAAHGCWLGPVGVERPDDGVPDAQFVLATRLLAVDHREGILSLVRTPVLRAGDDPDAVYDALLAERDRVSETLAAAETPSPGRARFERETAGSRADYEAAVRRAKEHVAAGDVYQCVLSRERERHGAVDPVDLYAALRATNPSPYMYLLAHDDRAVVGASPETLVSVAGDRVTANPIAGTCPRGDGPVEDRRLSGELLADDKERAEHTMLVDLARNDVRRVAAPGSVRVEEFMAVSKYAHVQHIESTVVGRLAGHADAFDAIRATFPAGTLAGAPKVRAMELVDELETSPRGAYGGGVGYVSWAGDADVAITIRTAVVEGVAADAERGAQDDAPQRVTIRAGAGIVADSDPTAEYEETERKLAGLQAALDHLVASDAPPEATLDGGAGVGE